VKRSYWILASIILIFLFGCSGSKAIDEVHTMEKQEIYADSILTISDYFPFKENTIMEYEGLGNEFAEKKTFVEFKEERKIQLKELNPGTIFVRVIEYSNGELKEIYAEGEFYHIENMLNANTNKNNVLLKEPLEVGNTWSNEDGTTKEITGLNKTIETPSSIYEALEVTTKFPSGGTLTEYYARDIGLVGSIYRDGGYEVKTLLREVKSHVQELGIISYYPLADKIGTGYMEQTITFETNDHIEEILENILKNPPSEKLGPSISRDVKINEIHLDREAWILEVDFSKEFADDLNVGSAQEAEMLKSVVNTLGKFYDVEKVYITIEGLPYESGHYSIKEGEYFIVDTAEVIEIK